MAMQMSRTEHLEEAEKLLDKVDDEWETETDWKDRISLLIQKANAHTAIANAMPLPSNGDTPDFYDVEDLRP